jgi:indole-3-glycerol phosphate synthase
MTTFIPPTPDSALGRICADKLMHVARQEHYIPQHVWIEKAKQQPSPLGFRQALIKKQSSHQPALIAEVKKASPSVGVIRRDFDAPSIALIYEQAGASCLSILTDIPYFQGRDEDLEDVKSVSKLPVLRKDFMLTPYQIYESRALGADCILLIMAALDDTTASELYKIATDLGMDVLVEIHDHNELDRALKLNPMMIGVNSRNLKTLQVNLQTAHDLYPFIPSDVTKVAESGISNSIDLQKLFIEGFQAFLVGESLLKQDDISLAVKKLLGNIPDSV